MNLHTTSKFPGKRLRHADQIRDYLYPKLLNDYLPAVTWQEDQAPFDRDSKILYCRQEGRPVDAFVRQVSVDVYLFSALNASIRDMNDLFSEAVGALEYIKFNPVLSDDIRLTVTSDVTGEFYTGQNRRYYRFQVLCFSA